MKITIEINDIEELISPLKKMLDHVFDNECKDGIDITLRLKDKDEPIDIELLNT